MSTKNSSSELLEELAKILSEIKIDFGGGCSSLKAYILAFLINKYKIGTSVDIGVYRGRSLFPQALAHMKYTKGTVYGVDPWKKENAYENDSAELKDSIKSFVDGVDFDDLYRKVFEYSKRFKGNCKIIRKPSQEAIGFFKKNGIEFGLVHIDGNHDKERVESDIFLYGPLLKKNGFLVIDDISWESVASSMGNLTSEYTKIFSLVDSENDFAIYVKSKTASVVRVATLAITGAIKTRKEISRRVVIFDNFFPNLATAFRILEYNYYLKYLKMVEVYSTAYDYEKNLAEYSIYYPEYVKKINKFAPKEDYNAGLFYSVFLYNTYNHLRTFLKENTPFIFTLYPGGGFSLNDPDSDKKLELVLKSDLMKKVIVTQKITRDYLLEKSFVNEDKIELIYGGVFMSEHYKAVADKRCYPHDKKTINICFVAYKYTPQGRDKGYDLFIETAKRIYQTNKNVHFHVAGNFDENDIDISAIRQNINFYGKLLTSKFVDFYNKMDIILSPTRAFIITSGSFDGFPTGACIEAGLNGVAVFTTDPLNQNYLFKNHSEIVIVNDSVNDIAKEVLHYISNLDELERVSKNGEKRFRELFDAKCQMAPRMALIEEALSENKILSPQEQEFIDIKRNSLIMEVDLFEKEKEIDQKNVLIKNQEDNMANLILSLDETNGRLSAIYNSIPWRAYSNTKKVIQKALPPDSRTRAIVKKIYKRTLKK